MRELSWLPLSVIQELEPLGELWGVSRVARGPRGFLPQWEKASGRPERLDPWWRARRNAFLARHIAQIKKRSEPLWHETKYGRFPTARHLALIFWAYSPDKAGIERFLSRWGGEVPGRK